MPARPSPCNCTKWIAICQGGSHEFISLKNEDNICSPWLLHNDRGSGFDVFITSARLIQTRNQVPSRICRPDRPNQYKQTWLSGSPRFVLFTSKTSTAHSADSHTMPKVSTNARNSSSSALRSASRRCAKVSSATTSSAGSLPDEYRFDFGRFRGKTLDQAGSWYVQYCIRNDISSQRPALGAAIRRWQARRSGGSVQILDSNDSHRLLDPDRRRRARILQRVPQWLYIECVCALGWGMKKAEYNECGEDTDLWLLNENDGWKRMEGMAKSDFPLQYPPPPSVSDSLPESASVRRFRELMLTFPKCDYTEGRCQGVLQGKEHIREEHDGWHLTDWYVLTEEYEDTIKRHLRAIEREHGKEAREIANWEVRDKYAENIQGVEWYEGDYPPARFLDHSDHWLL